MKTLSYLTITLASNPICQPSVKDSNQMQVWKKQQRQHHGINGNQRSLFPPVRHQRTAWPQILDALGEHRPTSQPPVPIVRFHNSWVHRDKTRTGSKTNSWCPKMWTANFEASILVQMVLLTSNFTQPFLSLPAAGGMKHRGQAIEACQLMWRQHSPDQWVDWVLICQCCSIL